MLPDGTQKKYVGLEDFMADENLFEAYVQELVE